MQQINPKPAEMDCLSSYFAIYGKSCLLEQRAKNGENQAGLGFNDQATPFHNQLL